jgi:hypothetical protein
MIHSKLRLNYRHKALIGLLKVFGGHLANRDFQKYLFLYTKEFEKQPSFDFVPYKYGCFSFQSYADKRRLVEIGVLANSDDWRIQESSENNFSDEGDFDHFYEKYSKLKGDRLIQDIYRRYPYYAINSEIATRLMSEEEINIIASGRPMSSEECFFTIGYEGSSFEAYLNKLIKNNINTLVDVRRNPLSRKYGFSKKTLSDTARKLGIDYIHIPELGIVSEKRQSLNTQDDYERLFDLYEKQDLKKNQKALENLYNIFIEKKRIAITCFEKEVCMCHRGRIAQSLSNLPEWHHNIQHI